jgi:putative spermidine/putrescine transport system permease protein
MTVAGIGIGTILVFVYGVGAYATPAVLGGRQGMMLGVVIYSTLQELADNGLAAALSIILLVGVALAIILYRATMAGRLEWLINPEHAPTAPLAETRIGKVRGQLMRSLATVGQGAARVLDQSGISTWRWPHALFVSVVTLFLLGPQVITTIVSFTGERSLVFPPRSYSMQWYRNFFTEQWIRPTLISLLIALIASALATVLAGMAATCVARSRSRVIKTLLTIGMLLPLIVPSVVSAAAFYIAFLPLGLTDSVLGLVLAHTCLLLPFSFGILLANLQSISIQPERAAASLGAPPRRVVMAVLLPQILSGIVLSFLLGVLVSFDEAVVGIFLSGIDVRTLPAQMYAAISREADPTVGVVGTIMLLFVGGAYLMGRSLRKSALRARAGRETDE